MGVLTIRVRTATKMVRMEVGSGSSVAELKARIATEVGVPVQKLKLSLKPDYSVVLKDTDIMTGPSWPNGTMVYVEDGSMAAAKAALAAAPAVSAGAGASSAAVSSPAKQTSSPRKLTARCTHGPNGACTYCAVVTDEYIDKLKDEPLNKAGRYAARHLEKSAETAKAGAATGEGIEWLCRHRPDQMCVNCAPLQKGDKVPLEMLCQHGPGGRCVNCLPPDSTVGDRKWITYAEWDGQRRAKCEHGPGPMCPNCTPPNSVSYKLKANCLKHQPWPKGLCSECQPPAADLTLQPYRHVDYIMFNNMAELQGLLSLWRRNEDAGAQRAAWMYGYYTPDPNYPSGTRVVVEALYEPPQAFEKTTGAIRLLPDAKKQKVADAIAGAAGLRRVGLFFTKRPKFPGDPELAPRELLAMATLQNAFPQSAGLPGSQFVTVVARADAQDQVAPQGYQATDQMMALVRDGVLADATPLDTRMKVKPTVPGEPPLPEVIDSSFKRGRQRVSEFDVERGLVTIETGAPTGKPSDPKPLYKHTAFPVENRSEYGVEQGNKDLKKLLALYKDEPMQSRLSDFHALLYLAQAFDVDTAAGIARAVRAGKPIEEGYQLMLEHLE